MIWIGSGFAIISSYLSAILNYEKQFFRVSLTSILPAFFMIAFVLLFHNELGVRSISLGFCVGFIIQFIILYKASKISLIPPLFSIKQMPYKRLLLKQTFLVTLSLLPFTILAPIAYFWASKLEIGSISYLGYSQSFAGFLSVAVSMGISIVALPDLSDKFANNKVESSLYQFEQSLRESTERTTNSGSALFGANKNMFQSDLAKDSAKLISLNKRKHIQKEKMIQKVFVFQIVVDGNLLVLSLKMKTTYFNHLLQNV